MDILAHTTPLMMPASPSVKLLMTPFPWAIDAKAPLQLAFNMMETHGVRHLPVIEDGEVVGVLSQRELAVAAAVGASTVAVDTACTRPPYLVEHDVRAAEVAAVLAERQIGSAIVLHHGKLAGIVTTTDICREYAVLHRDPQRTPDDCA